MAANPTPVLERAPEASDHARSELHESDGKRWRRRPILRSAIWVAVVIAPMVAASAAAIVYSRTVPILPDTAGTVLWWAGFIAAIVAAWLVSADLLQRTLPLATLLDLTLVFPDSVPSRFSILRRKVDRRQLETELRRLRERSDPDSAPRAQLILELAVALSIHDSRTRGHSERVRMFTDLVAHELHLRERDVDRLRWAALLHDIGKLAVAPELLNKPEQPDDDELENLRHHPIEGYNMIAPLHQWLGPWAATVRDHHERFDGTGYPFGLRGRAISLGGRIVAVTDSYETMTAGRPYRNALSVKAAREELVRRSGTHFDPEVVRAFLAISFRQLWPIFGIGALMAQIRFLGPIPWGVRDLGSRSASAVGAAAAATTLLVAGVAGPVVNGPRFGPAVRQPQVAAVTAPSSAASRPPAAQPSPPPPPAAFPSSGLASVPVPALTAPPATGPLQNPGTGAGGKALYPAGIAKHSTLPAGIAKKTDPFAQWRAHH